MCEHCSHVMTHRGCTSLAGGGGGGLEALTALRARDRTLVAGEAQPVLLQRAAGAVGKDSGLTALARNKFSATQPKRVSSSGSYRFLLASVAGAHGLGAKRDALQAGVPSAARLHVRARRVGAAARRARVAEAAARVRVDGRWRAAAAADCDREHARACRTHVRVGAAPPCRQPARSTPASEEADACERGMEMAGCTRKVCGGAVVNAAPTCVSRCILQNV
eukprot:3831660-Pleurochrysis_carterae.AAC.2